MSTCPTPDLSRHQAYLESLRVPTPQQARRISDVQLQKEVAIDRKYHQHTNEEHDAAAKIQAAYRGHRERRHINGLVLNPSSRWSDAIKEWRYRNAIASQARPEGRPRAPPERALQSWKRVGLVAEHAGRGERRTSTGSEDSVSTHDMQQRQPDSMLMDLRYFLEMIDQHHRYGANLQIYHEFWQKQKTNQNFFVWLDHGAGRKLDLPLCTREKLDRERIRYLSKEERKDYLVRVDEYGTLRWDNTGELITTDGKEYADSSTGIVHKGIPASPHAGQATSPSRTDSALPHDMVDLHIANNDPGDELHSPSGESDNCEEAASAVRQHSKWQQRLRVSPATILNHLLRASVKPGTWIYVADTVGRLYISIKSSGAFQHASFLSGGRISSAGSIGVENGKLTYLSPLSGHYRPTTKSFRGFLSSLEAQGIDLSGLHVSGAYKILRGMEMYGKVKQSFSKTKHSRDKSERCVNRPSPHSKQQKAIGTLHDTQTMSATEAIERNWDQGHHGQHPSI